MRKVSISIIMLIICSSFVQYSYAGIRCGSDIIGVGDSTMDVMIRLRNCGEVIAKEEVQKNVDGTFEARTDYHNNYSQTKGDFKAAVRTIEKWYIRVDEGRGNYYCYPLFFESGYLTYVGDYAECR